MNIFYVDDNPIKSAVELCNRHVIKMPSETVNMLLWPFRLQGIQIPLNHNGKQIKLSHLNHPCSRFTRQSNSNFNWVWVHFMALCEEYERRYKRQHASYLWNDFIKQNVDRLVFEDSTGTNFPRCFGGVIDSSDYKDLSTMDLYHKYYWLDKQEFARWPSLDKIPSWWYGGQSEKWVDPSFNNGNYTKR